MADQIFASIENSLKEAVKNPNHPFNYVSLATIGLSKTPRLRTVVLRSVDKDLNMTFYTDRRSKKVSHILENSHVSLLFLHPDKLMQYYVKGHAAIVTDPERLQGLWDEIPEKSKKDYKTELDPGSEIDENSRISYLSDDNHFCVIEFLTHKIEYLELKQPNHLRVEFRKETSGWESMYLIP